MSLRNKLSKLAVNLVDLAIEGKVLSGNAEYAKFIMLGKSRTGSNMVASALRHHRNVVAFGEIFNSGNHDRILWEYPGYRNTDIALALRKYAPREFISLMVFKQMAPWIKAVGFKLFYYHGQEENWQCIWPYLEQLPGLKIIHLKRRNLLRNYLSTYVAERTNQWSIKSEGQRTQHGPVTLNFEECEDAFRQIKAWENEYDRRFSNHSILNVEYENLVSDYIKQIDRIQEFLEVPIRPVSPSTKRQSGQPLSQIISNYHELKEKFSGTEWRKFFEE